MCSIISRALCGSATYHPKQHRNIAGIFFIIQNNSRFKCECSSAERRKLFPQKGFACSFRPALSKSVEKKYFIAAERTNAAFRCKSRAVFA